MKIAVEMPPPFVDKDITHLLPHSEKLDMCFACRGTPTYSFRVRHFWFVLFLLLISCFLPCSVVHSVGVFIPSPAFLPFQLIWIMLWLCGGGNVLLAQETERLHAAGAMEGDRGAAAIATDQDGARTYVCAPFLPFVITMVVLFTLNFVLECVDTLQCTDKSPRIATRAMFALSCRVNYADIASCSYFVVDRIV